MTRNNIFLHVLPEANLETPLWGQFIEKELGAPVGKQGCGRGKRGWPGEGVLLNLLPPWEMHAEAPEKRCRCKTHASELPQ